MSFFNLRSRSDSARKSSTTATSSTRATSTSSRSSNPKLSIDSSSASSDHARNTIYSAIALCGLAGYSSPKTRQYLRTFPEFDLALAQEPGILKIEGRFYTLQKTRHPSYMAFVNGSSTLDETTPTGHRIDADEILQAAETAHNPPHPTSQSDESDPITPEEELNRWKDTWTDECSILDLEGRTKLASRFRADIEKTYAEALVEAQRERRRADNMKLFAQGSLARRAAFVDNAKSRSPDSVAYKNHKELLAKARRESATPSVSARSASQRSR